MFRLATVGYGIVLFCCATAKFSLATVAKRFGQQRHSFVTMSRGIGLLGKAAFSNAMAKIGQVWQCEGKVMRDAAVQWLCIVALCEGEGWLCELKPR